MSENFFKNLSPAEKKRLAYIEGRPDLFETKVLKISAKNAQEISGNNILVVSRDPGSGNALLPVIRRLLEDNDAQITTITDGRAQEIFEENLTTEDVTPEGTFLGKEDEAIAKPDVILMDFSNSEIGLDTYVSATFPDVPKVLVEDYYSTGRKFLLELKKRNLPFPEKICVMDDGAKEIIIKEFPEMADRVEVTGQPSFDQLAEEDTEQMAVEVKKKLGLHTTDKLVSYMSTMDEPAKVAEMAKALGAVGEDFYFAFQKHPRDNENFEIYKNILAEAGVKVVDTSGFSTSEIGAASDVVLTSWSVEGLKAIYRRKPTVNIVDTNFRVAIGLDLPLVPVRLGASVGAGKMSELTEILPQLLDTSSPTNDLLRKKMEQYYKADGKNASRVAEIVKKYLHK